MTLNTYFLLQIYYKIFSIVMSANTKVKLLRTPRDRISASDQKGIYKNQNCVIANTKLRSVEKYDKDEEDFAHMYGYW